MFFLPVIPGKDDPNSCHPKVSAAGQQEEAPARRKLRQDRHEGVQHDWTPPIIIASNEIWCMNQESIKPTDSFRHNVVMLSSLLTLVDF